MFSPWCTLLWPLIQLFFLRRDFHGDGREQVVEQGHRERECLRRKLAADTKGAPLSVEVNLGQEQAHLFYFSVLELHIFYSRLGRVMIHYDNTKNTWHYQCSKPRKILPTQIHSQGQLHQSKPFK